MKQRGKRPTSNIQHPTSNGDSGARPFDLEERLLEFSAAIVALTDALPNTRSANHIGGQLLRSGTSPYLHHGEVQAAESLNDFVHKLQICLKELRESRRALRLIERATLFTSDEAVLKLTSECEELIRIFFQSVRTARARAGVSARVGEDAPSDLDWMLDVECWTLDVPPRAGEPHHGDMR